MPYETVQTLDTGIAGTNDSIVEGTLETLKLLAATEE